MAELPRPVVEYLSTIAIEAASPAFVRVDPEGIVAELGGRLDTFGLGGTAQGDVAETRIDAVAGLLTDVVEPFCLPLVEVVDGVYADIHLVGDADGTWVVLVDKTAWAAERRLAQQLANDMSLLRGQLERRRGTTGHLYAADGMTGRRYASVLTVILHGLSRAGDNDPVDVVVRDAGLFARSIARAITDEAGLIHALCGERLTAVFGVLPTTVNAPVLGVTAARRVVEAVDEINGARERDAKPAVPLSIGIASGDAVFGPLGGQGQQLSGAIGACVERAPRLAELAAPGSIAIDESTYAALGDDRVHFRRGSDDRPIYLTVAR